jgi:hypothetical protein
MTTGTMETRVATPGPLAAGLGLRLDHLIIRSATPEQTLAQLVEQGGMPVLVGVEPVGGLASGLVRAGAVDIEVLRLGEDPPPRPQGYGLGLAAGVPLRDAVARLRADGMPTSLAPRVTAGGRSWRAAQVHGLLPDPFPAPVSSRRPGALERVSETAAGLLARVPALARTATRHAGGSMVVLTEYGFDVRAWRASVAGGPRVVAVELGTAGHRVVWERLAPDGDVRLRLDDDGPHGIRRVELAGTAPGAATEFRVGDVTFAFVDD